MEQAIEAIQAMLEQRAGDQAKVIDAVPEPVPALPASSRTARRGVKEREAGMGGNMGKPGDEANS